MKNILFVLLVVLVSCSKKDASQPSSSIEIPELVLTDSLVIDRLTDFVVLDVTEDQSLFLLYDWTLGEFMLSNRSGDVVKTADLTGDGKNSFQDSYFTAARFTDRNEILVQTFAGLYAYDFDFILKKKLLTTYDIVSRTVNGSRGFDTYGNFIYTFSIEKDQGETWEKENFSAAYPFFTLRDIETLDHIHSINIPDQSAMALNPGFYNNLDPIVNFRGNSVYVLYPNSPEMYVYDLPGLTLTNSFNLLPGEAYKLAKPYKPGEGLAGFFNSLAAGEYTHFAFSNGYLITSYEGAAPQDEMDALDRNIVGGPEFQRVIDTYKKPYYQIFKDEEKIWEGQWDVTLGMVRNLIYSKHKIGEDPDSVEKDVQTLYFYEIR
ncbi:hypothetical protein [Algoriphagus namhaensis]